jgi:hypothetical protein
MSDVETRLATLEAKVALLEKGRSGRKAMPILCSVEGICGVEPAIDSSTCPYASLYRRQQGCLGEGCKRKSSEYYTNYRANRATAARRKKVIKRKR